jgi:hypothetical protein
MRLGHHTDNYRAALAAANELMNKGYAPVQPMLSWHFDALYPQTFETWMSVDFAFISTCDCLLRISGKSEGADLEMDYAVRHEIPVYTDIFELYNEMPSEVED